MKQTFPLYRHAYTRASGGCDPVRHVNSLLIIYVYDDSNHINLGLFDIFMEILLMLDLSIEMIYFRCRAGQHKAGRPGALGGKVSNKELQCSWIHRVPSIN